MAASIDLFAERIRNSFSVADVSVAFEETISSCGPDAIEVLPVVLDTLFSLDRQHLAMFSDSDSFYPGTPLHKNGVRFVKEYGTVAASFAVAYLAHRIDKFSPRQAFHIGRGIKELIDFGADGMGALPGLERTLSALESVSRDHQQMKGAFLTLEQLEVAKAQGRDGKELAELEETAWLLHRKDIAFAEDIIEEIVQKIEARSGGESEKQDMTELSAFVRRAIVHRSSVALELDQLHRVVDSIAKRAIKEGSPEATPKEVIGKTLDAIQLSCPVCGLLEKNATRTIYVALKKQGEGQCPKCRAHAFIASFQPANESLPVHAPVVVSTKKPATLQHLPNDHSSPTEPTCTASAGKHTADVPPTSRSALRLLLCLLFPAIWIVVFLCFQGHDTVFARVGLALLIAVCSWTPVAMVLSFVVRHFQGLPQPWVVTLDYFDVSRPSGHDVCSDRECPCPDTKIPRGSGYLYISDSVVRMRSRARTDLEAQQMVANMQRDLGAFMVFDQGQLTPILMCEQGAERRHLNLEIAARDAEYWWETGKVPLAQTPTCTTSEFERRISREKLFNCVKYVALCVALSALPVAVGAVMWGFTTCSFLPDHDITLFEIKDVQPQNVLTEQDETHESEDGVFVQVVFVSLLAEDPYDEEEEEEWSDDIESDELIEGVEFADAPPAAQPEDYTEPAPPTKTAYIRVVLDDSQNIQALKAQELEDESSRDVFAQVVFVSLLAEEPDEPAAPYDEEEEELKREKAEKTESHLKLLGRRLCKYHSWTLRRAGPIFVLFFDRETKLKDWDLDLNEDMRLAPYEGIPQSQRPHLRWVLEVERCSYSGFSLRDFRTREEEDRRSLFRHQEQSRGES